MVCPRRRRRSMSRLAAGGGQSGLGCRGEQGGVGTDGHEGPALFDPLGGGRTVGDQQPAGLAVPFAGGQHGFQCLDKRGSGGVAGHAEVVAEVPGSDEQHVDTVDRGDLVDGRNRGSGFDLGDDQDFVVGTVQGAGIEPEPAGPVVGGHPADPARREPQVGQCLANLIGTVDAGQHDSRGTVVQDAAHPDPGVGLDPDHGGHPVGTGGRDDVADLFLTAGAVLQVQQQPVEPGSGADLGGERGRGAQEGAQGGVAVPDRPGQRAIVQRAVQRSRAHPSHRWVLRSCSYSARSGGTVSTSDTSAGATSHHTPAGGRSACGIAGTTITTVPW